MQRPITLGSGRGNRVVLALGRGRFAEHAHLKPGGITVRQGQRVTKGQVMGPTGNSGSSTGPHLHFQMMDAPSATDSDGLPYVFERFDLQGRMPPLSDALLAAASRGESLPLPAGPIGPHRDELLLGRDVVTLP
jgi:murein DD-endopeptidase MepM/ murein hydrolase activator NlpD